MVSSFKIELMQRPCKALHTCGRQSWLETVFARYGDMLLAWQESIDVHGAGRRKTVRLLVAW